MSLFKYAINVTMPAISVQNVTKKFKFRMQTENTLRETFLKTMFTGKKRTSKTLTALDNLSFTIEKGEMVGIIGDNGSGKSTLLRLILGITPPTAGEIQVHGTVAALLELGSGFHPILPDEKIFILMVRFLVCQKHLLRPTSMRLLVLPN